MPNVFYWQNPFGQSLATELHDEYCWNADKYSSQERGNGELRGEDAWNCFMMELVVGLLNPSHLDNIVTSGHECRQKNMHAFSQNILMYYSPKRKNTYIFLKHLQSYILAIVHMMNKYWRWSSKELCSRC